MTATNDTSLIQSDSGGSLSPSYPKYPQYLETGQGSEQQVHPLKLLHLFLRGRYLLLFILVLTLSPIGAWFGYRFGKTDYQSYGQIRMLPELPPLLRQIQEEQAIPMFDAYLDAEAASIRSQRTLDLALQDPEWKNWKWPLPDNFSYTVAQSLQVNHLGELINIYATGPDPKAAMLTVRTIVRAYKQLFEEENVEADTTRNDLLDQRQTQLRSDVATDKAQIIELARNNIYGTDDLTPFYNDKLKQLETINAYLSQAKMVKAQNAPVASGPDQPASDDDSLLYAISGHDPLMARALQDRQQWKDRIDDLTTGPTPLLPNNDTILKAQAHLDSANKEIKKRKDIYDQQQRVANAASVLAGGSTTQPSSQPSMDTVAQLEAASEQCNTELQKIGRARLDISEIKDRLANAQGNLEETTHRIESLQVEASYNVTGRLRVISDGNNPYEPSKDTHIAMAALGGFGGMTIGSLFVVLLGMRDRRFRGPEDTPFSAVRCPMLGMLPTLTNDLSDPEQAAMAAHFTHGIRAMLQIKSTGEGGRVIAITSPSSGNGKTSISLALGVSFAGAHSKTLLIDCDFIGRALSDRTKAIARPRLGRVLRSHGLIDEDKLQEGLDHALQHGKRLGDALVEMGYLPSDQLDAALVAQKDHTFGVLEAIDGEDLAECTAPTAIPGLSILPLGQASAEHIGSLSPSLLRQVLDSTRQKYDVIIVDTGPILGSLEAAMIATQADDVVVVLSNGENRSAAERSLRYLESIGAKVAGFVFNRATNRDFNQSDSAQRMSNTSSDRWKHSRSWSSTPSASNHFGPIAHAVAQSMNGGSAPRNGQTTADARETEKNGAGKNGPEKNGSGQNGHSQNGNGHGA